MSDQRRAMLESIAYGEDERVTPADRLRALDGLAELDALQRDAKAASTHEHSTQRLRERDPARIEQILELALEHVGPRLIERRAEELARKLLAERRQTSRVDATGQRSIVAPARVTGARPDRRKL